MPPRVALLLCWCAAALPAAAQVSPEMKARIMEGLPKYNPPAADAKSAKPATESPVPLSDENVVHLPDYWVIEKKPPGGDPDNWLGEAARKKKAMKDYKNSMGPLEWALNCFYIPFLTPSTQARADEAYRDAKMAGELRDLGQLVEAISKLDPAEAKKLSRALDLDRHPTD